MPHDKFYKGPEQLDVDVASALTKLNDLLSFQVSEYLSHSLILVQGLNERVEVIQGVAVYLVGAIASCIEFNLEIRAALFDEDMVTRDLYRDVVNVIGADNDLGGDRKTDERDPWLWEGISHLLLHLSLKNNLSHPPDRLVTKTSIHLSVKDHGLDVVALYGTTTLGVTAGECKAYLDRPTDAITDAANRLREVDEELRDAEIRAVISQFRPSLSPEQQASVVRSFWHKERAYFPMVCCNSSHSVNWKKNRIVLRRLKPPTNRKFLVSASIDDAESFFDAVAEAMRKYASGKL